MEDSLLRTKRAHTSPTQDAAKHLHHFALLSAARFEWLFISWRRLFSFLLTFCIFAFGWRDIPPPPQLISCLPIWVVLFYMNMHQWVLGCSLFVRISIGSQRVQSGFLWSLHYSNHPFMEGLNAVQSMLVFPFPCHLLTPTPAEHSLWLIPGEHLWLLRSLQLECSSLVFQVSHWMLFLGFFSTSSMSSPNRRQCLFTCFQILSHTNVLPEGGWAHMLMLAKQAETLENVTSELTSPGALWATSVV